MPAAGLMLGTGRAEEFWKAREALQRIVHIDTHTHTYVHVHIAPVRKGGSELLLTNFTLTTVLGERCNLCRHFKGERTKVQKHLGGEQWAWLWSEPGTSAQVAGLFLSQGPDFGHKKHFGGVSRLVPIYPEAQSRAPEDNKSGMFNRSLDVPMSQGQFRAKLGPAPGPPVRGCGFPQLQLRHLRSLTGSKYKWGSEQWSLSASPEHFLPPRDAKSGDKHRQDSKSRPHWLLFGLVHVYCETVDHSELFKDQQRLCVP